MIEHVAVGKLVVLPHIIEHCLFVAHVVVKFEVVVQPVGMLITDRHQLLVQQLQTVVKVC